MVTRIPCAAIIFDFDGTLADSMPFLEKIGVKVMMKYYGVSKNEATSRYRATTGLPYEHQVRDNFQGNPVNDEAVEEFEKLKIDKIYEQVLFPDAIDTVNRIVAKSIPVFVSSSTFQATITEYFRRRGILELFAGIFGYRPGFEKGADHFRYAQSNHGVDLSRTVFVGDSLKDYQRTLGYCQFIALEGMFSEKEFREAGHDGIVVSALGEIPDLVVAVE
ncbi:MAG: HAD family hydrolase [Candidatus Thorarchaeota archaeon]|nr:MAG: HAD family hydrolase [Candidatus Thorarchaeota archaeon]